MISILAKYIGAEEEMDAVEMHEPYTYLNGLTVSDLEDLLVDINVYEKIDLDRNRDYWNDIITIVNDELHKLRKLDSKSQYEEAAERRQGINKAVAGDVQQVFKGKSSDQLADLQIQIEKKLTQRSEGIDVGYWESLLSQLKAHLGMISSHKKSRITIFDQKQHEIKYFIKKFMILIKKFQQLLDIGLYVFEIELLILN